MNQEVGPNGVRDFQWDLPKVHAISHVKSDIERSGTTNHYNTELYENLHQRVRLVNTLCEYVIFLFDRSLRSRPEPEIKEKPKLQLGS